MREIHQNDAGEKSNVALKKEKEYILIGTFPPDIIDVHRFLVSDNQIGWLGVTSYTRKAKNWFQKHRQVVEGRNKA